MVLVNIGALLGPNGIALVHAFGDVLVTVESGFVSDDEILVIGGGALQDVESSHHGDRDAGDGRVGIARFEGVYRLGHPWDADMILDGLEDFAGGGRGVLGLERNAD